jgi:hypothetical protein
MFGEFTGGAVPSVLVCTVLVPVVPTTCSHTFYIEGDGGTSTGTLTFQDPVL